MVGFVRVGAIVGLLGLVALGCSGGGDGNADSGGGESDALASLVVIDTQVDVNDTTGDEGQPLAVGDTVATNPEGFGEVAYFDGSVTRVAKDAEFTLTALSDTEGERRVEATLDAGTSWNRVEELSGTDGAYIIDTPVAQAAATGTAFAIDCTTAPESCVFTAVEGTIEITPDTGDPLTLDAPATITITTDEPPPAAETLTDTDLADDDWIATNLELDTNTTDTTSSGDDTTTTADPGDETGSGAFPGTYEVTSDEGPATLECSATECRLANEEIVIGPFQVEGNRVTGSDVVTFTINGADECAVTFTMDATANDDGTIEGTVDAQSGGCASPVNQTFTGQRVD